MYNLGQWAHHVDLEEMLTWYKLPEHTARDCASYQPDSNELELPRNFDTMYLRFVEYVRRSVIATQPAYHNDDVHFAQAERDGMHALDAYEHYRPGSVPLAVRSVTALSIRGHDSFHCGATFRAQAPRPELLPFPNLGHRVSSEWVTAYANDLFLREEGLCVPARLHQMQIVWSSTYGGNTPLGTELRIPEPRPRNLYGAIMRACDVCTPEDPHTWLQQTIAVNYGEVPAIPPGKTWRRFIIGELKFAGYIRDTLDAMDAAAQMPLSQAIGWRDRLVTRHSWIDQLERSRSPLRKFAEAELQRYGVTLR